MAKTIAYALFMMIPLLLPVGCDETVKSDDGADKAIKVIDKLKPLFKKLEKPGPNDWLANHDEKGQTFREYLSSRPKKPTLKRTTIYIQPLGEFTKTQKKIVDLTAEFMGHYFNLKVKVNEDIPLSVIPNKARRTHPTWNVKQILSTYVLDDLLEPKLPKDAMAMIAFTTSDLWPGEGWNFVFGQASLINRVGVWSIYRNGDPHKDKLSFKVCLRRTLKTATHEMGHMFSILHCIKYECNMCGSNHRQESDKRPIALCPECVAKVWWATGADPIDRYKKLKDFCSKHSLDEETRFYKKAISALSTK